MNILDRAIGRRNKHRSNAIAIFNHIAVYGESVGYRWRDYDVEIYFMNSFQGLIDKWSTK